MGKEHKEKGTKEGEVLDANLLIEGERGTTTIIAAIEYPPAISESIILWPNNHDYLTSLTLSLLLRKKGTPVGSADIIMASMCINRDLTLKTKDKDFVFIKDVEPSFKLKLLKT